MAEAAVADVVGLKPCASIACWQAVERGEAVRKEQGVKYLLPDLTLDGPFVLQGFKLWSEVVLSQEVRLWSGKLLALCEAVTNVVCGVTLCGPSCQMQKNIQFVLSSATLLSDQYLLQISMCLSAARSTEERRKSLSAAEAWRAGAGVRLKGFYLLQAQKRALVELNSEWPQRQRRHQLSKGESLLHSAPMSWVTVDNLRLGVDPAFRLRLRETAERGAESYVQLYDEESNVDLDVGSVGRWVVDRSHLESRRRTAGLP